jgi:hypothetical protein
MFEFDIIENTEFGLGLSGKKTFYNTDGKYKASDWVRDPLKGLKTYDCPQMTSATRYRDENGRGKLVKNSLGYFLSNANSIQSNGTNVSLVSSAMYKGNGLSIIESNFDRVTTLFSARKLIGSNWLNEKDEYFKPNVESELYTQFYIDSIIYSLFNDSSEQSSLIGVRYKGKNWDIKNEFFWMPNSKIRDCAGDVYNHSISEQYCTEERFVYKKLFGEERLYDNLSEDAKQVIDIATELIIETMSEREYFSTYENQSYNWDAGYSQLKKMWKQILPEKFDEFRQLYKNLENRMRPLVYELGFLIK